MKMIWSDNSKMITLTRPTTLRMIKDSQPHRIVKCSLRVSALSTHSRVLYSHLIATMVNLNNRTRLERSNPAQTPVKVVTLSLLLEITRLTMRKMTQLTIRKMSTMTPRHRSADSTNRIHSRTLSARVVVLMALVTLYLLMLTNLASTATLRCLVALSDSRPTSLSRRTRPSCTAIRHLVGHSRLKENLMELRLMASNQNHSHLKCLHTKES